MALIGTFPIPERGDMCIAALSHCCRQFVHKTRVVSIAVFVFRRQGTIHDSLRIYVSIIRPKKKGFVYILLAMLRMEVEEGGVVCQPQEA